MLLSRYSQATDLIDKYSNANIFAIEKKRGSGANGGGTWAIEPLVYAYASYLSNEFYKAVLDAFTAAVSGDMVKVLPKEPKGLASGEPAMDIKAIIVNKEVVDIRLDSEGRANMNDIHAASGGKPNKRPGSFLRSKKARKLVESLEFSTAQKRAVVTYEGGDVANQDVRGTYGHVDLMLAYAAWICRSCFAAYY